MYDFSEPQSISTRTEAFKALQETGYKLWQWLDHGTTVWWGPGRTRVLARENQEDGTIETMSLPPLKWEEVKDRVGTIAGPTVVRDLFGRSKAASN